MPMIDTLTAPQRMALDDVRDGISRAARARKQTIDALLDRGFIEPSVIDDTLKLTLTEAGRTLYIESDMRTTKPGDFHKGDEIEAIEWRSDNGKYTVTWKKGVVRRVGTQMLNCHFSDGVGLRRAYYCRKVQTPAPSWGDQFVATIDAAPALLREQQARIAALEAQLEAAQAYIQELIEGQTAPEATIKALDEAQSLALDYRQQLEACMKMRNDLKSEHNTMRRILWDIDQCAPIRLEGSSDFEMAVNAARIFIEDHP
jgi:hypothetical protein